MGQGTDDLEAMSDEGYSKDYEAHVRMRDVYDAAKRSSIGSTIHCPTCDMLLLKRTRGHTFCGSVCRNRYWNITDENRRKRVGPI